MPLVLYYDIAPSTCNLFSQYTAHYQMHLQQRTHRQCYREFIRQTFNESLVIKRLLVFKAGKRISHDMQKCKTILKVLILQGQNEK